jgi:hypothetical protein
MSRHISENHSIQPHASPVVELVDQELERLPAQDGHS